jgi:hypothetical protein
MNADTFLVYVEYVLSYHAFCHHSHLLPRVLHEDYDLIDYASWMVGMYFDSILYQGDNTVNSDTCKIHIQLPNCQTLGYFGDHMQTNMAMGEQGLKV